LLLPVDRLRHHDHLRVVSEEEDEPHRRRPRRRLLELRIRDPRRHRHLRGPGLHGHGAGGRGRRCRGRRHRPVLRRLPDADLRDARRSDLRLRLLRLPRVRGTDLADLDRAGADSGPARQVPPGQPHLDDRRRRCHGDRLAAAHAHDHRPLRLDTMDAWANNIGIVGSAVLSIVVVAWLLRKLPVLSRHLNAISSFKLGWIWMSLISITGVVLIYMLITQIMTFLTEGYEDYPALITGTYGWGMIGLLAVAAIILSIIKWPKQTIDEMESAITDSVAEENASTANPSTENKGA